MKNPIVKYSAILAAILLTTASPAAEFSREGPSLKITGKIVAGDFERFKQTRLQKEPNGREWLWLQVALESSGGDLYEGLAIGRYIREQRDVDTIVYRRCTSACALIWLAGTPRFLLAGARIGFHAPHEGNSISIAGNAAIGAYLRYLGMPLAMFDFTIAAPPDGMTWLTEARANDLALKIVPLSRKAVPLVRPQDDE